MTASSASIAAGLEVRRTVFLGTREKARGSAALRAIGGALFDDLVRHGDQRFGKDKSKRLSCLHIDD